MNYSKLLLLRVFFAGLLVLTFPRPGLSQQAIEVRLQELPNIQRTYGSDSARTLVGGAPIWLVNQPVALTLLREMPATYERYSHYRSYLKAIGKSVRTDEVARLLEQLLVSDLVRDEQLDYDKRQVQLLDEELLLALLYQAQPETEELLVSCLRRYAAIQTILAAKPKPNPISFFLKGLGNAGWSSVYVNLSIYQLLATLNRMNPSRFPSAQVAAQHKRLHFPYNDYSFPPTPVPKACYKQQQVAFEKVMRQGVSVPRQCATGCSLIKLVESEQVYFVETFCTSGSDGFGGYGNTYLVQHYGLNVDLCYVSGWIS